MPTSLSIGCQLLGVSLNVLCLFLLGRLLCNRLSGSGRNGCEDQPNPPTRPIVCGQRLNMGAPVGSWATQTLIAGLTQDALIAPWVIKGAMDGPAFAAYVREVLVPKIEPGTVVILDNLATHKTRKRQRPCARMDAGPSSYRHTRPT